eukprot:6190224-Pleurochrysis_carterae.AAC.1
MALSSASLILRSAFRSKFSCFSLAICASSSCEPLTEVEPVGHMQGTLSARVNCKYACELNLNSILPADEGMEITGVFGTAGVAGARFPILERARAAFSGSWENMPVLRYPRFWR